MGSFRNPLGDPGKWHLHHYRDLFPDYHIPGYMFHLLAGLGDKAPYRHGCSDWMFKSDPKNAEVARENCGTPGWPTECEHCGKPGMPLCWNSIVPNDNKANDDNDINMDDMSRYAGYGR